MSKDLIKQIKLEVAKKLQDDSSDEEIAPSEDALNRLETRKIPILEPQVPTDNNKCLSSKSNVINKITCVVSSPSKDVKLLKVNSSVNIPNVKSETSSNLSSIESQNSPKIRVKSFALEKDVSQLLKDKPKSFTTSLLDVNQTFINSNKEKSPFIQNGLQSKNIPVNKFMRVKPNILRKFPITPTHTSSITKLENKTCNNVEKKIAIHSVTDLETTKNYKTSPVLEPNFLVLRETKINSPLNKLNKADETGRSGKKIIPMETYRLTPMLTLEKTDFRPPSNSIHGKHNSNQFISEIEKKSISRTNSVVLPNANNIKDKSTLEKFVNGEPKDPLNIQGNNSDSDDSFIDEGKKNLE